MHFTYFIVLPTTLLVSLLTNVCFSQSGISKTISHFPISHLYSLLETPKLAPSIKEIDLLEGSNFVLSCNVDFGTPPYDIRWFQETRQISESVNKKIDIFGGFSTLTLKNLSKLDSGIFKCQVNNAFGADSSETVINIKGSVISVSLQHLIIIAFFIENMDKPWRYCWRFIIFYYFAIRIF